MYVEHVLPISKPIRSLLLLWSLPFINPEDKKNQKVNTKTKEYKEDDEQYRSA